MKSNKDEKPGIYSYVVVITILIICVSTSVVSVLTSRTNSRPTVDASKLRVLDQISGLSEASDHALKLAQDGKHLQAAIEYSELAVISKYLYSQLSSDLSSPPITPTLYEIQAKQQFFLAGYPEPYKEYLKLKSISKAQDE